MKRLILLFISLLVAVSLYGQKNERCHQQRVEDIQNAKIAFFTHSIDLTPEEAKEFWPLYNRYFEKIREARKNVNKSFRALKAAAEDPEIRDNEIQALTEAYLDNRQQVNGIEEDFIKLFGKILPPRKVARIYVAEEEFRVRMIHQWRNKARGTEK